MSYKATLFFNDRTMKEIAFTSWEDANSLRYAAERSSNITQVTVERTTPKYVGKVVQFRYLCGSKRGATRTVLVDSYHDTYIMTRDLDDNLKVKRFNLSEIEGSIRIVNE